MSDADLVSTHSATSAAPANLSGHASDLSVLFLFTERLHRAHSPDELYSAALDAIIDTLHCERSAILLFDAAGIMRFAAWRGLSERYRNAVEGHSPWTKDTRDAEPICVADIRKSGEPEALKAAIAAEGIGALAFIPVIADGALIGKFMAYYDEPHHFTTEQCEIALMLARQLGIAIARMRAGDAHRRSEDALNRERLKADGDREHLAAIVESSSDAIVSKTLEGIIQSWNKGAERLFGYTAEEIIGKPVTVLIPEERHDEEPDILRRIRAGERLDHYETLRRRKDGTLIHISLTVSPLKNASGKVVGASKIARDITEKKQAEAERDLLVAELSHRVKNTLATVISIARQSFANPDTEEARRSFDSRIRGLAQTHSRLAEANWSGVSLATIVDDELSPYRNDGNVHVEGPAIELNPKCALTLGLALHELATNAAKYGALSVKDGAVHVSWMLDAHDRTLRLSWIERGGPVVKPPLRAGFGRLLIERALASDLNGTVELEFAKDGLRCAIAIPENQYGAHPA